MHVRVCTFLYTNIKMFTIATYAVNINSFEHLSILILANQSEAYAYWHIFYNQYIDLYIIYQYCECEYQFI
jgi:hypothetical protein